MDHPLPRRALVSVSDKTGLESFVRTLVDLGFEIVSTGGTRHHLEEQGINVIDVSSYTGFPEIMDGRVKTLHPKIHGAILGRPDVPNDSAAIREHDIVPFELVVCNLYPFEQTIAQEGVTVSEAIEQIDIGGPSMVRAAAKNHAYTGIVTHPSQYERVQDELRCAPLSECLRRELAATAFEMTARYDRAIADYAASHIAQCQTVEAGLFPKTLTLTFQRKSVLRYGENPHQQAAFYADTEMPAATLAGSRQLHGKDLSYNNLLDLDAALTIAREFSKPAAVIIKHNNPCGCAVGENLADAFQKAYVGDPVSAFGSVLGFNRTLDLPTVEQLCQQDRFIEAIIAPDYEDESFEELTTRPKWKKTVRLIRCSALRENRVPSVEFRDVAGGLLVQDRDEQSETTDDWKVVTKRKPSESESHNLKFAWIVCKHVKSNAIVLAKQGSLVGVGAGQMSRVDSTFIATHKAGERSHGSVLASDAFFPFRDGIDTAAAASVSAIIQPGGSRGDEKVITACNDHGIAMIFTGRRHFKH